VEGHTFITMIADSFDNIIVKEKRVEDGQSFIYYRLDPQFQTFLARKAYNPIRLPMLSRPNNWTLAEGERNGTYNIENIGGYLLDEYNEFSDNRNIIRNNKLNKNKDISEISSYQVKTINYLNSQVFEVNKNMLEFVLEEWYTEDSVIFENYNKLHPFTEIEGFKKLKEKDKKKKY